MWILVKFAMWPCDVKLGMQVAHGKLCTCNVNQFMALFGPENSHWNAKNDKTL